MCFMKLFKPKAQKEPTPKGKGSLTILGGSGSEKTRWFKIPPEADIPDEEYQLPTLARGNFSMTEELRRRQQAEQLKQRYGICTDKEGSFV